MAARRSRIRPACGKEPPARCISLIFAIPTATNCARFIGCRRELSQIDIKEDRPSGRFSSPPSQPNRARPLTSRSSPASSIGSALRCRHPCRWSRRWHPAPDRLKTSLLTRSARHFRAGAHDAASEQGERDRQQQQECAENHKALAHAPAGGDPTYQGRYKDGGEPLTGLTQTHYRAL